MVLNYIWIAFFLIAFVVALGKLIFAGDTAVFTEIINSSFASAKTGFEISLGLTGILSLWLGIMKIGEKGGVIQSFARLGAPVFSKLFPGIPKEHPVTGSIFMNISANLLGLDNAATPMGLKACLLYTSGIQPLQQYPIKGVIWYQGESNAQNIETHERLFPLLVESWRKNWGEEFPFYYVQLSSIDRPSWTWFRNSQRELMETIPNSGMAVSSDRGDSLNVHPVYKREIGERLARWALNKTYGHALTPSGPLFRSVEFRDNAAYITFDYACLLYTSRCV